MELSLNENIYVVSDLHINHHKLCTGYDDHFERTRKYSTVAEMNNDIVRQWNDIVTPDDIVIFLGDFTLNTPGGKLLETFNEYCEKLNFKHMYVIRGNHDYRLFEKLYPVKDTFSNITLVSDYILLENNSKKYLFQHFNYDNELNPHDGTSGNPTVLNHYMQNNVKIDYLVHGHTHELAKTSIVKSNYGNMVENNVSWEAWYRPVHLDELKGVFDDN